MWQDHCTLDCTIYCLKSSAVGKKTNLPQRVNKIAGCIEQAKKAASRKQDLHKPYWKSEKTWVFLFVGGGLISTFHTWPSIIYMSKVGVNILNCKHRRLDLLCIQYLTIEQKCSDFQIFDPTLYVLQLA